MSDRSYPRHFYAAMHEDDGDAPTRIVDCILSIVRPASVVDVGCGNADFLASFLRRGIEDIQGVDLPIDPKLLRIPADRFTPHDLTKPFKAPRQYDLVVSLEVGEHLPESAADVLVDTCVGLGDIVVFSAAVPEQAGFRHINLQWQDYWAEKFRARGFVAVDCLRDRMWKDDGIPFFYRQNVLMYVREASLPKYTVLQTEHARTAQNSLSRVHPLFFMSKADPQRVTLRFLMRALAHAPQSAAAAVKRRLRRRGGAGRSDSAGGSASAAS